MDWTRALSPHHAILSAPPSPRDALGRQATRGLESLSEQDPELFEALAREQDRQLSRLMMVASASVVDPSVLACQASAAVNVTAEGYPGRRYHAGCAEIDVIESLAIARAQAAFGARYANVQPHSATTANQIVMFSLLEPGDTLLGMALESGGHLTHGSPASYSGSCFRALGYGLDSDGYIDLTQVRDLARRERPRLIICGATAYSRSIDFASFRAIADEIGAHLLADISHVAGLVVAGLHPSPIDHAHVTTTCTHKQLFGPRGGLILAGRDHDRPLASGKTLADCFQRAVFPFFQGAPVLNAIAAKARALAIAMTPDFHAMARRIVDDAAALAGALMNLGYRVVSGGTDNHIVLLDLTELDITGLAAERALEECHIVVNKNRIPGDRRSPFVTSGIRIGTNALARWGLTPGDMSRCAGLVHKVLADIRGGAELSDSTRAQVRGEVAEICARFHQAVYAREMVP